MAEKNTLTEALLEAHHLLRCYQMAWYGKYFNALDPYQGQGRILNALKVSHIITQKELGKRLHIRSQQLGEHLQKLEENGYIKRHRSTTDKRALIVELTDLGEMFNLHKPDYDELFIDLSADEKTNLKESLKKISERLTELIKKENEEEIY